MSLEQILDLEKIEVWTYRGFSSHAGLTRVFGGQVAGEALVAAGRTVPADRRVHSLHAYFLRPGDTGAPLLYSVEPVRDGGSFTTRRVLAVQHGEVVFSLSASFAEAEEGIAHQVPALAGPGPEESPDAETVIAQADPGTKAWYANFRLRVPLEVRLPEGLGRIATVRGETRPPRQRIWVRSGERLPDDPLIHVCAVTYLSDLFLLSRPCCRTAWWSGIRRSTWPASITRSGSTRRSGPTSGCSTSRRAAGRGAGGHCARACCSTVPESWSPR